MPENQLVRLKIGKQVFEVLTKVGSVLKYRDGKLGWDNVPVIDEVFKNHTKGERAKSDELLSAFKTDNVVECMKIIVQKGELQVTAAERKEKLEKKRAEIVNYIHKYYTDPKMKTPHPVVRIENALEQLRIRVDPDIPVERQVQEIVKKLPEVLPIKRSEMQGLLSVSHSHVGIVAGILQQWAKVIRENYTAEGCEMELSIIPGDYDMLMSELNRCTKGDFQFHLQGQERMAASMEEETITKGKKGKQEKVKGETERQGGATDSTTTTNSGGASGSGSGGKKGNKRSERI